ncbi:hypothetical protein IF1G_01958 [Cordyceps javanica]|uniref:Uncharacterized protein n=1 Tax=Cordyceps javanica TaxID=43265 RepID=A0A545VDE1_9HYPO|nr:hypothetical protein IF1G_01958 [Cordyceps javanica]
MLIFLFLLQKQILEKKRRVKKIGETREAVSERGSAGNNRQTDCAARLFAGQQSVASCWQQTGPLERAGRWRLATATIEGSNAGPC